MGLLSPLLVLLLLPLAALSLMVERASGDQDMSL
jgi:hypothetical protein